jgi:hypothetical protein
MMTVRHVEPDGREHVFQVESLDRTPEGELVFNTAKRITSGKVYVMDAGKTVAMYDFSKQHAMKEQK